MHIEYLDKRICSIDLFSHDQKINSQGVIYRPDFLIGLPNNIIDQSGRLLQPHSLEGGNDFSVDRKHYEGHIRYIRRSLFEEFVNFPGQDINALDIGCGPKALSTLYLPSDLISQQDILDVSYENLIRIDELAKKNHWNLYYGDMHTISLGKYHVVNLMSALDGTRFLFEALENIKQFLHPGGICFITQDVFGGFWTTLGLEVDYRMSVDMRTRIPAKNYLNPMSCMFGEHNELFWIVSEDRKSRKTSYDFLQNMQEKAAIEAGYDVLFKGILKAEDHVAMQLPNGHNLHERYFVERTSYDDSIANGITMARFYEDVLILRNGTQ
ncbi:MAG: class I SAM-dependent methyltransferase [Candidatus Woesearchaeota archaeon]|nr:class I SAM-dependent methyltransferase [Candidatus Woesearchaeota archaeon]